MARVADPKAKSALLRAAEEAFAARGVAGSRVEDIAKEAGLSKGAFYLHFESKEAALAEIVQTWLERCISLFAGPCDYPETPSDPDAMLDFCIERDVRLWEFFWKSRTTMRVLLNCSGHQYAHMFVAFRGEMERRNRQWLERWRQDGFIRVDIDADVASALMGGGYEQLSIKTISSEHEPPIERWLEQAQEAFVRAFGTPELVATLERRNRRMTTGIHDLRRRALHDVVDGGLVETGLAGERG